MSTPFSETSRLLLVKRQKIDNRPRLPFRDRFTAQMTLWAWGVSAGLWPSPRSCGPWNFLIFSFCFILCVCACSGLMHGKYFFSWSWSFISPISHCRKYNQKSYERPICYFPKELKPEVINSGNQRDSGCAVQDRPGRWRLARHQDYYSSGRNSKQV